MLISLFCKYIFNKTTNEIIVASYYNYKDKILSYWIDLDQLHIIKNDYMWNCQYSKSFMGKIENYADWIVL